MSRGLGGGGEPYITHDGSDVQFDPRAVDATGTVVFAASTDAEPHFRLATGANHTASLVAGDMWFDGTNFKGYDGASSNTLDVQATSAGGFTDDGTRVRLTTATNHVAIGTVTPALTGSGDLTVTGNFDLEGHGTIGNGAANNAQQTLLLDRDFTSTGTLASQLLVRGDITAASGIGLNAVDVIPAFTTIDATTIGTITSMTVAPLTVTNGFSTSITVASTLRISAAPTEGDDNYAVFVDAGATRLDGNLQIGTVSPSITGDGDLVAAGNFDFEGHGSIGNGFAVTSNFTIIVDRDFTAGTGSAANALFNNSAITSNATSNTTIANLQIDRLAITDGGGTVTNLASVYVSNAPTYSGTLTNGPYSIFSDAGLNRFDGDGTDVFELPADATDPTSGGGAATGRIPVKIGGSTVYIPYY